MAYNVCSYDVKAISEQRHTCCCYANVKSDQEGCFNTYYSSSFFRRSHRKLKLVILKHLIMLSAKKSVQTENAPERSIATSSSSAISICSPAVSSWITRPIRISTPRRLFSQCHVTDTYPMRFQQFCLRCFEKINYQKSILLYKIKHEPSPSYLHQLFPTTYLTSRVLRSNTQDNLNIPRPNTEKFKHSFQYSGARLWNDLPANIRNSNSLYSFKNSMLKHIKSKRDTH